MGRTLKPLPWLIRVTVPAKSRTEVDGLWIGATGDKGLDRVLAALALIKLQSALHYHRVVRDLDRIIITVLGSGAGAEYQRNWGACALDERMVTAGHVSVEDLAATIVHEATHARLERLGFKYVEDRRRRIEDICMRRELAFAAHLPNPKELREAVDERTKNPWDLTDSAFRERRKAGEREALQYMGVPNWSVAPLYAIGSLVSAIRRLWHGLFGEHHI